MSMITKYRFDLASLWFRRQYIFMALHPYRGPFVDFTSMVYLRIKGFYAGRGEQ